MGETMAIEIRALDHGNIDDADRCDGSFDVDAELRLAADDGVISYEAVPVPPYCKRYPHDEKDRSVYIDDPRRAGFLAYLDGRIAGRMLISANWNNYALVEDIEVDRSCRGCGVGRALIERGREWAMSRGLPGMMLETQSNNLAACRFYERCGFILGGFDRYLYRAQSPGTTEVAMYWYLIWGQHGRCA